MRRLSFDLQVSQSCTTSARRTAGVITRYWQCISITERVILFVIQVDNARHQARCARAQRDHPKVGDLGVALPQRLGKVDVLPLTARVRRDEHAYRVARCHPRIAPACSTRTPAESTGATEALGQRLGALRAVGHRHDGA